ncbi:CPCC family cysteine-rich protein [Streptomyces sp. PsTaAH-124]|uniref:CPCC family cysteine-rich protein n=1 Tax=Streptomyces sp. PsTaAH-124 TaxID=1157638 RepID=UPI000997425B|nr:CPCC family cysteine-rich protein [Streptomyces sp. PsTaAH-124]
MPGSYEICPVCFWEDDGAQFRWPTIAGGANKVSLIEAQRNEQDFGACDQHGRQYVRPTASGTSGSRAQDASATPATPPPTSTAGLTSNATSPTADPVRGGRLRGGL